MQRKMVDVLRRTLSCTEIQGVFSRRAAPFAGSFCASEYLPAILHPKWEDRRKPGSKQF